MVAALRQFDNKISVIGDFEKRLVKNYDQLNSGVQNRLAMTDQEIRANTNSISQIKIDIGIVLGELKEFSAELSTYNQNNNEQDGLATTNPIPLHSTSNAAVQKNVKSRGITSSNKTVFQRMERADGKIEYHRIY